MTNAQNENLKMVLDSLRTKFENLEMEKESEERSKDLIIADLESKLENASIEKESEIENLRSELSLKQREFEVLSSELVTRSKSKFQQIDSLKKQLSDAERSLVSQFLLLFFRFYNLVISNLIKNFVFSKTTILFGRN